MTTFKKWTIALVAALAALALAGCSDFGHVAQGRVIAYDAKAGQATVILESATAGQSPAGVLPPVIVKTPVDREEMGPAPAAGKLVKVDLKAKHAIVFDPGAQAFRTIDFTPVEVRRDVKKAPSAAPVDKKAKTITLYAAADRATVTFPATDELLAMPADTWKSGDVVRYYFKDPNQALRMMNVTKTDLNKAGE